MDICGALPAPGSFHRLENARIVSNKFFLLVRPQLHHRPVLIGISEGRENFAADTKIGMMHVRRFNRFGKTQRQLAKFVWCHGVEDLLGSSSCSI